MLFKWYNLQMWRRKKKISTKEWKKKIDSCLHSDSWRLDLYSHVGDLWWSTYVCAYVSTCTSPSSDKTGHVEGDTPLLWSVAGKQLSQPLHSPLSLIALARAKWVSLLFTSFILLLFRRKCPRHLICRWIHLYIMPLCDYRHSFLTIMSNTIKNFGFSTVSEISKVKSQTVLAVLLLLHSVRQKQGKALWQSAPSLSNKLCNNLLSTH